MIEFESGGRDVDPLRASNGAPPGHIREIPAQQLYHFQWHLLRVHGPRGPELAGPAGAAVLRTLGARARVPAPVIIGCFVGWHMRGAVELRASPSERHRKAHIALTIESAWEGHGIGTALMAQTVRVARERCIEHLYLTCHALNLPTQRIAEAFGAKIGFEGCECFAEIALQSADY